MEYDCKRERIRKRRDGAGLRAQVCLRRRGPHHQRRQPGITQTSAQAVLKLLVVFHNAQHLLRLQGAQ